MFIANIHFIGTPNWKLKSISRFKTGRWTAFVRYILLKINPLFMHRRTLHTLLEIVHEFHRQKTLSSFHVLRKTISQKVLISFIALGSAETFAITPLTESFTLPDGYQSREFLPINVCISIILMATFSRSLVGVFDSARTISRQLGSGRPICARGRSWLMVFLGYYPLNSPAPPLSLIAAGGTGRDECYSFR